MTSLVGKNVSSSGGSAGICNRNYGTPERERRGGSAEDF